MHSRVQEEQGVGRPAGRQGARHHQGPNKTRLRSGLGGRAEANDSQV